jgi:hypothetical protein
MSIRTIDEYKLKRSAFGKEVYSFGVNLSTFVIFVAYRCSLHPELKGVNTHHHAITYSE